MLAVQKVLTTYNDLELDGVGGEAWKALWIAARRYSEEKVYPDEEFPYVDGKCVLCHQDLDSGAVSRFSSFEEFVQDNVQQRFRSSALEAERVVSEVERLPVMMSEANIGLDTLIEYDAELMEVCSKVFDHYEAKKETIKKAWCENITAPEIEAPCLPEKEILVYVESIDENLEELQKQLDGLVSAETVQEKIDELSARKSARKAKKRILEEINRLGLKDCYERGIRSANTRTITSKSKKLSSVVTKRMAKEFVNETKKLRVNNDVDVALEASVARYGISYHKITSPSADPSVPLSEILSEGEHRAIGIAAFMTEASSLPGTSSIIFDDPVTSLDHDRKEAIAIRIAEEAQKRQVIVFTHDLPFIFDLRNAAKKHGALVTFKNMYTNTGTGGAGNIGDGLPWYGMNAKSRIGVLRDKYNKAAASFKKGDEAYEQQVLEIYRDLRQTWESVVETALFHNVVTRFDRDVKTTQLRYVFDNVTEVHCDAIDEGMSKCSLFVHDAPTAKRPPLPKPNEIDEDISNIESLVTELKSMHKGR